MSLRIEKYKTPVSRRYGAANRIAQSFRMIITTMPSPGKISRGGVRPFVDNASMSHARENRRQRDNVDAQAICQPIDKSMCADAMKSLAGRYREEVEVSSFRTGWMRNIRLYVTRFPRLSLHFVTTLKKLCLSKLF